MNIPNILTIIRFILIPVFGYFLYEHQYYIAIILFVVAGMTDVMDGFIARRFNMITSFGKLADPLADKLMQITALVLLTIQHEIPVYILLIIIVKEGFMAAGGIVLYKKENYVVQANWFGKISTAIFYFAIIMVLFEAPYSNIFIIIAALSTLLAFFIYLRGYINIKRELKAQK